MVAYRYLAWVACCITLYVAASFLYPKSMFLFPENMIDGDLLDGFSFGVKYTDENPAHFHSLWFVHWIRYLIAYPFWWVAKNGYPDVLQNLIMLVYFTPLFLLRTSKEVSYLRYVILLLPFFLSYRACLTISSITILYLYLSVQQSKSVPLMYSAILANLSSGVVISWLATAFLYRRTIKVNPAVMNLALAILVVSILSSVVTKINFFDTLELAPVSTEFSESGDAGEVAPREGSNSVARLIEIPLIAISRNTLSVSYVNQQYRRLAVYLGLFVTLGTIVWHCIKTGRGEWKFFSLAFPGYLFEGLWVISYLLSILLFLGSFCWKLITSGNNHIDLGN